MKINAKRIKSTELLASALGIGSVGAAIGGIGGAIFGSVIGFGVAIWNEQKSQGLDKTEGKKAHA